MAKIQIIGNVGKDPELKFIKGGNGDFAVTKFSVAETEKVKEGDAWIDGKTTWFNVSATGKLAETLIDAITKGTRVMVYGDLKFYEYQKDGETKSGMEVRASEVTIVPTAKKSSKPKADDPQWNW